MLTLMFDLPGVTSPARFSCRVASPGRAVQGVHDLVGDGLDQGIDVRSVSVAVRRGALALPAVAAGRVAGMEPGRATPAPDGWPFSSSLGWMKTLGSGLKSP